MVEASCYVDSLCGLTCLHCKGCGACEACDWEEHFSNYEFNLILKHSMEFPDFIYISKYFFLNNYYLLSSINYYYCYYYYYYWIE